MSKIYFLLCAFLFSFLSMTGTHNRAGEITYRHVSGFTYEVTITTCTKSSVEADREWILVNWGDSPFCTYNDSIQRTSETPVEGYDAQTNVYIGFHTYAGIGAFRISVLDPNRNAGVLNISGSVNVPFYIESELIISPITGHNNSVQLLNPAKSKCCFNKLWVYNPGAYDPDGDQLVYSLIECKGDQCMDIGNYQFPDQISTFEDTFTIDSETGTIVWDVPPVIGEYNIAILIEEFRQVGGELYKVGSVIRDMQLKVEICDNDPPVLEALLDTCILINNPLTFEVFASDPDGDDVDISAVGGPMSEVQNQAQFNNSTNVFTWIPECPEVRLEPYQVVFIAEDDNNQVELQDIETINITVIAPEVENPSAESFEGLIALNWDVHECIDDYEESEYDDFSYKIYRKNEFYGFDPAYCETGVPAYTGYELVATIEGLNNNTFVDETVFYGGSYCYMIVTCWPDGAESIASEEVCAEISKDVPVMTNVTVLNTDLSSGIDSVAWSPPTELDTDQFPGPYQYKLYWGEGYNNPNTLIYESSVDADLMFGDTTFVHTGINTFNTPNVYNVEFYSGSTLVATSSDASSVFIELIPDDNQLTVEMNYNVPWQNESFEVYRLEGSDWVLIGTTTTDTYIDEGLNNNQTYCYYAKSIGTYNAAFVVDPIENLSQEACGFPVDLTPPCPPELTIEPECELEQSLFSWSNPFVDCGADDVMLYQLYYSAIEGGDFELIETFVNNGSNNFTFNGVDDVASIAGCFYITAVDSLQPGLDGQLTSNESDPSNVICIDNCPEFSLPNVFSPNGDGYNDVFRPFDPILYVDSVDFQVFNRWGGKVYQTNDPLLGWDGTNEQTGELCADGTYYYVASVYTLRLAGIVPIELSGYIQILDSKKVPTN